jgi:hypothetical protein
MKTWEEYQSYVDSVGFFFEREGIHNLSQVDSNEEAYFSWSACECCGSNLGGDRYHCNGFKPTLLSEVSVRRVLPLLWSVICLLWSVIVQSEKLFDARLRKVSNRNIELGDILEYEICSDCLYFAEYDCLDDMTMMNLEIDNEVSIPSHIVSVAFGDKWTLDNLGE